MEHPSSVRSNHCLMNQLHLVSLLICAYFGELRYFIGNRLRRYYSPLCVACKGLQRRCVNVSLFSVCGTVAIWL